MLQPQPESRRAFVDTKRGSNRLSVSAMGNDPMRALVELITNSDDSYSNMEAKGAKVKGSILIEIERSTEARSFTVKDRAEGINSSEWYEKLQSKGNDVSDFENNPNVRGTLGFGLKDINGLGGFEFESIKDGQYSCFAVKADGDFNDQKLVKSRPVTNADKKRLGINKNNSGSSVTVHLRKGVGLPMSRTLENKIRGHYELRSINQSQEREIRILDSSSGESKKIHYADPKREIVFDELIDIPSYPDAEQSHLIIYRNAERDKSTNNDPTRPSGILIQGRKAIYENTLFSFENNPTARQFSGQLQCGYIDKLSIDYDKTDPEDYPETNPMGIITPSRQGLEKNHPFRRAIQEAVNPILENLINQEDSETDDQVQLSRSLRTTLNSVGQALGREYNRILEEFDQDPIGSSGSGNNINERPDTQLIPKKLILFPNEKKTLSLIVRSQLIDDDTNVQVEIDADPSEDPLKLIGTQHFKPHKVYPGFSSAQVRLQATSDLGYSHINVTAGNVSETAEAETVEYKEQPPIEEFKFQNHSVQCKANQKKEINLYIPVDIFDRFNEELLQPHLAVDNPEVFNINSNSDIFYDEVPAAYVKPIEIEGRQLGLSSTIRATLGKHRAQCQVKVGQNESDSNFKIEFLDEKRDFLRAETEESNNGVVTIRIMAGHPITRKYMGEGPNFTGSEDAESQILLAEIVAAEATEKILERVTKDDPNLDGAAYNNLHKEYLDKFLRVMYQTFNTAM